MKLLGISSFFIFVAIVEALGGDGRRVPVLEKAVTEIPMAMSKWRA